MVILFDIDGTLILTDSAGQHAMEQVEPQGAQPRRAARVHYAGRTDRSIVADHLDRLGLEDTEENFRSYTQVFLQRLPDSLAARNGFILPGVEQTLRRLHDAEGVSLGLLTGNMRLAAEMKLSHFGLQQFFMETGTFVGGFGDRHHDRDDVARDALAAARQHFRSELQPEEVWIVGDTPRDVKCARAIGANVLAVSTGGYSVVDLAESQPDLMAEDLTQADAWWDAMGI